MRHLDVDELNHQNPSQVWSAMSVLVRVRCVGEQEALVVASDPTLTLDDDQKCCQRHPDVPHEAGIRPVYTREEYPEAGFEFE